MAAVKQGLLKLPAFEYVGALELVNIGLPENLDSWNALHIDVAESAIVSALLPERSPASHKGTFGTAFVTAGSTSYTGAALLAGEAAYRIGAGLVTMAVPEPLHAVLAGHLPEATWVLLPHKHGFISETAVHSFSNNLKRATAVLIGPGLGDKETTRIFVEQVLSLIKIPAVFNADGLRHLSNSHHWYKKLTLPAVLTPHPGEMSALTGLSRSEYPIRPGRDRRQVCTMENGYGSDRAHRFFFGMSRWRRVANYTDPAPVLIYHVERRDVALRVHQESFAVPLSSLSAKT